MSEVFGMGTPGLYEFLIDVLLALATLVGTTALLWVWFRWLAGRAMRETRNDRAPSVRGLPPDPPARRDPDQGPPSASPAARAEIAELEALWKLSRDHSDPP
jgi:hypothetical protein